jgi:hypothetical protein
VRGRERLRKPEQPKAVGIALGGQMHGLELHRGQRRPPDHDPRAVLELVSAGDGPAGSAAEEGSRLESLVDLGEQPLRHPEVMTRGEDEREVATPGQSGPRPVRGLRGGRHRVEALRRPDRDLHSRPLG